MNNNWTKREIEILKTKYGTMTNLKLSKLIGRSVLSLGTKACLLKLPNRRRLWTKEEEEYLKKYYQIKNCKRIGLELNRGAGAVQNKAQKLGLTTPNRTRKTGKKDVVWTQKEKEYLRKWYKRITADKISQKMNRTITSVYHQARRMGLNGKIKFGIKKSKRFRDMKYYEWRELCREIRKRDGNKCVICGYKKHLEVHHIHMVKDGGSYSKNNLITLCPNCHAEANAGEISMSKLKSML